MLFFPMVETMLLAHDIKEVFLTDVSKSFDCISHNLPIAKLDIYGLIEMC